MRPALRVAWYRFRTTFGARWAGLLAIVLLIALLGGLAMGAVAGARRTQSSYPAYLAHTNASDMTFGTAIYDPSLGDALSNTSYDAAIVAKIARLPLVQQVGDLTGVDPNITALGAVTIHAAPGETPPIIAGSLDGENSTLDRVTVTQGRLADPKRTDEVIMSASAARELGAHVGSVLPVAFFTNAQLPLPGCCSGNGKGKLAPHLEVNLKLVGIVVFNSEVLEDDVDALGDNPVLLTPALMHELVKCCSFYTDTAVKVDGGSRNVTRVQAEITRAIPKLAAGDTLGGAVATSTEEAKVERAVGPESIALGVFGAIAALAALLIAGQLIGRQLRFGADERAALRALGAGPATTAGDGLLGVLGAIALGSMLAWAGAVGLSPLAPLGPVRRLEHATFAIDWTVIGLGLGLLVVVLGVVAVAVAFRQAPHRVVRRNAVRRRGPRAGRAAARAGLSIPAVTGIRFALEPGAGRNAVPVRSAIIGAVLSLVVVISTLTFGASLQALVSHPALYGWNWNYQLLAGFSGQENLPQKQAASLLDHDRYVSAWTGIYFATAMIDDQEVPAIATSPGAAVAPPLLSGRGFDAANQIVLGATTLADLHKHVGDTVSVNAGEKQSTELRIVGTATMPAIGNDAFHTTMGAGALLSYHLVPASQRNVQGSPIAGPEAILIRIRKGADPAVALRSLQQINDALDKGPDSSGGVTGVLRPAEIVNYRSMGTTPALLGAALAAGAVAALALTLIASVRRRRRELALLKTLGFTRRQLAAVVAWQSSIAVAIGVVIGVPLGVVAGRSLWDGFARAVHVVPDPTVPGPEIALIAIGALVVANIVAAIPGFQAARTRTAALLRAE